MNEYKDYRHLIGVLWESDERLYQELIGKYKIQYDLKINVIETLSFLEDLDTKGNYDWFEKELLEFWGLN